MASPGGITTTVTTTSITFNDVMLSLYDPDHQITRVFATTEYISGIVTNIGHDDIEGQILASPTAESMSILVFENLKPSTTYYIYGYTLANDSYFSLNLSATTASSSEPPSPPSGPSGETDSKGGETFTKDKQRITSLYHRGTDNRPELITRLYAKDSSGKPKIIYSKITPPRPLSLIEKLTYMQERS